jgi:hypothetical protein
VPGQAKSITTSSTLLQLEFCPVTSDASYIPSSVPSVLTHHFPYLQLPICFQQNYKVGLYLTAGFKGFNNPPPQILGEKRINPSS